jgi:hypothetical protein
MNFSIQKLHQNNRLPGYTFRSNGTLLACNRSLRGCVRKQKSGYMHAVGPLVSSTAVSWIGKKVVTSESRFETNIIHISRNGDLTEQQSAPSTSTLVRETRHVCRDSSEHPSGNGLKKATHKDQGRSEPTRGVSSHVVNTPFRFPVHKCQAWILKEKPEPQRRVCTVTPRG